MTEPTSNSNPLSANDLHSNKEILDTKSLEVSEDSLLAQVEYITPEIAELYLNTMPFNQRSADSPSALFKIKEYANKMRQGKWTLGEPIMFNKYGEMFQGQHRMRATIEAGVTVAFLVVRGYSPDAMTNVDIGRKRSAVDIAKIQGVTDFSTSRSAVLPWFLHDFSKPSYPKAMGEHERIDTYLKHQKAIDFACQSSQSKAVRIASVRAIIARAYYFAPRERLQEFVNVLATGQSYGEKDWAGVALRNKLESIGFQSRVEPSTLAARYTQSALISFLKEKPLKVFRAIEQNLFPYESIKQANLQSSLKEQDFQIPKKLSRIVIEMGLPEIARQSESLGGLGRAIKAAIKANKIPATCLATSQRSQSFYYDDPVLIQFVKAWIDSKMLKAS